MDQPQTNYSGWTLIELFGHGAEAGYVTTQYFGDKAMFQVDVPELPARKETLQTPRYIGAKFCPEGTEIEREAVPGRTRLLNPGAVYAMNPATKEAVMEAITRSERREIKVLSVPEKAQMPLLPGERNEFIDDEGKEAEEEPQQF